jgi:hypothetical protein
VRVRFVRKLLSGAGGLADRAGGYAVWYDGREDYWRGLVEHLDENGQWRDRISDEEAFARWGGIETKPVTVRLNPVTKPPFVTKPAPDVTKPLGGRPRVGEEAMTAAERNRQSRLRPERRSFLRVLAISRSVCAGARGDGAAVALR